MRLQGGVPYLKNRVHQGDTSDTTIHQRKKTCRVAESCIAIPKEEKRSGHRTPVGFLPLGKRGAGVSPAMHYTAEGVWHPLLISNIRKMDFAHNRRSLPLDYKIPADDINASENGKFCPVLMI